MNIVDYIPFGKENAVKRSKLRALTKMDDRNMREAIEKAQMRGELILNMQDGAGYFRPILPEERDLVERWQKIEKGRWIASMNKYINAQSALEATAE